MDNNRRFEEVRRMTGHPPETNRIRLAEIVVAGSALLMVLAAQWILSNAIHGTNYYDGDGKPVVATIVTAFRFGGVFHVTNINHIEGVGSQLLPKNVWANPAFWPFGWLDKETAADVSALVALACFASALYFMMRCFDVPVLPSALAGQSCITLFAPTLLLVYTPAGFCLTPGDAVVYAPYMAALGLLGRLDPGSWPRFGLIAAAISLLVLYSIYCDPLWTMIAAISWAIPFAVVTLGPLRLKAILVRAAALACCLALLLVTGIAGYLYTLSQYTARVQFPEALDRARVPTLVSAMTYSSNMKYFYLACVFGALLGLLTLAGRSRVLAAAALTAFAAWGAYSTVYLLLLNATWVAPIPLYVEQSLFALCLAGGVAGFYGALTAIARAVGRGAALLKQRTADVLRRPASVSLSAQAVAETRRRPSRRSEFFGLALSLICTAIIPAKAVSYAMTDAKQWAQLYYEPWLDEPELVAFLAQNVGLAVGRPVRGSVAFWDLNAQTQPTAVNLWAYGVHTIDEYSQLVTPPALYFL